MHPVLVAEHEHLHLSGCVLLRWLVLLQQLALTA